MYVIRMRLTNGIVIVGIMLERLMIQIAGNVEVDIGENYGDWWRLFQE